MLRFSRVHFALGGSQSATPSSARSMMRILRPQEYETNHPRVHIRQEPRALAGIRDGVGHKRIVLERAPERHPSAGICESLSLTIFAPTHTSSHTERR